MPLVSLKPVLREAKAKGYAVAAFHPVDYASMKAMIVAAEELKAPVIIQTSAKTINNYGHAALAGWMQELAGNSPMQHDPQVRGVGLDVRDDRWVRPAAQEEDFDEAARVVRELGDSPKVLVTLKDLESVASQSAA